MFYKIIHHLVDIPPHGILLIVGKYLIHPAGMTVVISKYQQELKPMQIPTFPFASILKLIIVKHILHQDK